jgi:hypothetical protein
MYLYVIYCKYPFGSSVDHDDTNKPYHIYIYIYVCVCVCVSVCVCVCVYNDTNNIIVRLSLDNECCLQWKF